MNELKFNSQICTTKEQSQRLLELGLKPETADMYITNMSNKGINYTDEYQIGSISFERVMSFCKEKELKLENTAWEITPAWSLHRLIEILPKTIYINPMQWYLSITPYYNDMVAYEHCGNMESNYLYKSFYDNVYDNIINCIEWLINNGYFKQ